LLLVHPRIGLRESFDAGKSGWNHILTSPWLNFCIGGGVYPHLIIHQFGKPEEM
jgi:hypothetical protein